MMICIAKRVERLASNLVVVDLARTLAHLFEELKLFPHNDRLGKTPGSRNDIPAGLSPIRYSRLEWRNYNVITSQTSVSRVVNHDEHCRRHYVLNHSGGAEIGAGSNNPRGSFTVKTTVPL